MNSSAGVFSLALLVAVCAALFAYQGCAVYDPSLLLPGDAGDAGSPPLPCEHASYPDRPPHDDPSSLNVEVVLAMQSIDFGLSPDAGSSLAPFGFDLDHVCTCPGPSSCVQEQGAPRTCDDDAGRDHAGLALFRELGSLASTGNDSVNQGLKAGAFGLLFDVRNYNGTANDTQVDVSIHASNGILPAVDGGLPRPSHDGTDRWTLDPSSLNGGDKLVGTDCDRNHSTCAPIYFDDNAYVTGNVLVAKVDAPISFGTKSFLGGAVMRLKGSVIVGKLSQVAISGGGQSYAISRGTIAGRWPTRDFLATLAYIPDQFTSSSPFLCGENLGYQYLRYQVCRVADITSDPTADNTNAPCDAVSVGFQFDAEPARLGTVVAAPPAPQGCVSDGGLPFADSCSALQ